MIIFVEKTASVSRSRDAATKFFPRQSLPRDVKRSDLPVPLIRKGVFSMNGTKLGFFALIFLFGATMLAPVLVTGIASADCGSFVRDCDNRPVEYHCSYVGDVLRCDGGCALRDYDGSTLSYYDGNAVRDRDNFAGEYRCDLCGCGWLR
jgi:hypothetical protein